jgi:phosphoribosylformimino-5-aminoimidazole carboxamide ribotide isomerase
MQQIGVRTMIVTDISRDGAMQGTNRELYAELSARYQIDFIASGGVSSIEDVRALRAQNLYGAIIGKAYYTGAIDLAQAIKEANV